MSQRQQCVSMENLSPSKFDQINDQEVEELRDKLQLSTYACLDSGVTREQLYAQSAAVHSRVMGLLVRQVRLKRAAEKKASFLEKELGKKCSLLETSLQELEVLQASSTFARDDLSEAGVQTEEEIFSE